MNPVMVSRAYHPLTFFWIAFYRDRSAVPQFNPETGVENKWCNVEQARLVGVGWFPFPQKLSQVILERTGLVTRPTQHQALMQRVAPGQKVVVKREQQIIHYGYHRCLECGNMWQVADGPPNPYVKLARSRKAFVEEFEVTTAAGVQIVTVRSPICPACGYHDSNAVMKQDKQVVQGRGMLRVTRYVLGLEGRPLKYIDEAGGIGQL